MANSLFHSLNDVRSGSYHWNVKVRIVRLWRGKDQRGEDFKSFNILLLDDKKCRLHAFVPSIVAEANSRKIHIGQVHTISNFTVKDYKPDEKYRCVRSTRQIVITPYTEIVVLEEDDVMIPPNVFDFYDLEDVDAIANDNTYLTDLIGVIDKDMPLRKLTNKLGIIQSQVKFDIYDGRCTKSVTFWDFLADEFERELSLVKEYPVIIIIASARITSWRGSANITMIDISNVSSTVFYLNSDHHSSIHLRKMFSTPTFSKHDFSSQIPEQCDELVIQQIKDAGEEYSEKEVTCQMKISTVLDMCGWFFYVCTSCSREIDLIDGLFTCNSCRRNLTYPDKKFRLFVEAEDHTGSIKLKISDREISTFIGQNVFQFEQQESSTEEFPMRLKDFQNKTYVIKILIQSYNVAKESDCYVVKDMYVNDSAVDHPSQTVTQDSISSYHLSGMSQLNFDTPDLTAKKKNRKKTKKFIQL